MEDDDTICHLNAQALRHSGYHVDAAEDGAVAWETLQRSQYDLVVTDNDMPNVSGVELLKRLRASDIILPVIMASGVSRWKNSPDIHLSGLTPSCTSRIRSRNYWGRCIKSCTNQCAPDQVTTRPERQSVS